MGASGFCGKIDHQNNGQNPQNLATLQQLYLGLIDDLGAQKTTTGESAGYALQVSQQKYFDLKLKPSPKFCFCP